MLTHSPDDSPLTAYLLGELAPAEVSRLEEQLAESAALRDELDALRGTVAALQAAFAQQSEVPPAVPAINRDKLHSLLRSAVVSPAIEASTAAPLLLPTQPPASRPARGRGLMVGGALAMVLGLVAVSQFEPKANRLEIARNDSVTSGSVALSHGDTLRVSDVVRLADSLGREIDATLPREDALASSMTPQLVISEEEALMLNISPQENASLTQVNRFKMAQNVNLDDGTTPQSSTTPYFGLSTAVPPDANFAKNLSGGTSGSSDDFGVDPAIAAYAIVPGSHPDDIDFYELNRTDSTNFSSYRSMLPAGLIPASPNHWADGYADPALVAGQSRGGLGRAKMDGANLGFEFIADSSGSRRRSTGRGLARSLDLYGLPAIQQGVSDANADGEARRFTVDDALFADVTGANGPVTLLGRHAAGASDRFGETAGVATHTAEVAQLRAAVDNLQQLVASSSNGREESRGLESKLGDLSEELMEQQLSLAKLAEPLAAIDEARSESIPAATQLSLVEAKPEVVSEQTLALAKAREEVNRAYTAWYYREGRIRQAREIIAAAESYAHVPENDFVTPDAQPLSTFGIDVDSASYANVRRFVESNQLPPPDAVRIEELVNSFKYDGPPVAEGEAPLALAAEVGICPWQPQHQLLRVALKGKSIDLEKRPAARLVFLVDTSGSMSDENKLPLVKQSLRLLVEQMREQDRLSIVTYSDNAGLWLDSTGGDKRAEILAKIDALVSDGSTNGEAGLKLAYEVAVKQFAEGATNRVMLCTDGDFNVGESSDSAMVKLIEKERQTGVFLNIFGFGSGNLKDAKLEAIADKGNGQYIYIDGIKEARKTLLNELTGTLYTIAKDVKLQLEFNPALVGSYRLVGYENRVMAAQDFANDKVDSGDMGAGHSVVALYEIVPAGAPQPVAPKPEVEPLKYQPAKAVGQTILSAPSPDQPAPAAATDPSEKPAEAGAVAAAAPPADPLAIELCTIRVRYKQPTSNESTKIETVVADPTRERGAQLPVSRDHVWATAVAEFGLVTKQSSFVGTGNYSQILELAQSAIGDDPTGQRREFVTLVRQAQHLTLKHEARLAEISDHLEDHRRAIQQIKAVEKAPDLMTKASCSGKYKTLLRQIEVADDQPQYTDFKDYGRWDGTAYKTHQNLPNGYWVYVAPHWYIWGESTEQAAVK